MGAKSWFLVVKNAKKSTARAAWVKRHDAALKKIQARFSRLARETVADSKAQKIIQTSKRGKMSGPPYHAEDFPKGTILVGNDRGLWRVGDAHRWVAILHGTRKQRMEDLRTYLPDAAKYSGSFLMWDFDQVVPIEAEVGTIAKAKKLILERHQKWDAPLSIRVGSALVIGGWASE